MVTEKSYKPNGCKVAIRNNKGTIQLRYTYNGSRIEFSLGLDWLDLPNHHKAIAIAQQIHNDIYLFGNYDDTKEKYRIKKSKGQNILKIETKELTLRQIWEYYKKYKESEVSQTTIKKWKYIDDSIKEYTINQCDKVVEDLLQKYATGTIYRPLVDLRSAINFYINFGKYKGINPLSNILSSLEDYEHKTIKVFSQDEIRYILDAFKNDLYNPKSAFNHSYYYHFVAIRFLTGMRPSETIPLTWNDIISKNAKQWLRINKRYVDGELKEGTKNGVDVRLFPINGQLQELIESTPKRHDQLIFPAVKGGYIDRHNFGNRIWSSAIESLVNDGLVQEYLPFYHIRHTFISHMARSGKVDLKTLATICGNSVDTIIKKYLAVDESIELPNIF